jgi:hypothetical protein
MKHADMPHEHLSIALSFSGAFFWNYKNSNTLVLALMQTMNLFSETLDG